MNIPIPKLLAVLVLPLITGACQSPAQFDRSAFLEHQPKSILVLPPLDETLEVDASYGSLSTLTKPLAERGYYVFPVAVVDAMMRSNGLPMPSDMHQVSLAKLNQIFAPDAVLYVTVKNWGTSYQVLNSQSAVTLEARLVDARSGVTLWSGEHTEIDGTANHGDSLYGLLAIAIVNQVVTSISDPSVAMSSQAADGLFNTSNGGLLPGPYHPEHEQAIADAQQRRQELVR
jgi:hypothetical protein